MTTRAHGPEHVRLDALTVALQPVMNLQTGQVHGFEALLRGPGGSPIAPRELFLRAQREGFLAELEQRAASLAMDAAERHLRDSEILFLNIERRIPPQAGRYPHLVVEIDDAATAPRALVQALKTQDIAVYLDNYGMSQGNISSILDIRPRGLKLDAHIAQGMAQDSRRFAIARTLTKLARDLDMDVVAKGIETSEDLCAARSAGFVLGQGYYLCRPALTPDRSRIATTGRLMRGSVIEMVTTARERLLAGGGSADDPI